MSMQLTTTKTEIRSKAALLWQRILLTDRRELFLGKEGDIRDRAHGFDRLPQPGFVGAHYTEGGILLIGQNPGADPIGKGMSLSDQLQYGLLEALRDAATSDAAVMAFSVLMDALATRVMPNWAVARNVVRPTQRSWRRSQSHFLYEYGQILTLPPRFNPG
jgi:hypothetical protein